MMCRRYFLIFFLLSLISCNDNLRKNVKVDWKEGYEVIEGNSRQEVLEKFENKIGNYISTTSILINSESTQKGVQEYKNIIISSSDMILADINEYQRYGKYYFEFPKYLIPKIVAAKMYSYKNKIEFEKAYNSIFVVESNDEIKDIIKSILKSLKKVEGLASAGYLILYDEDEVFRKEILPFWEALNISLKLDELRGFAKIGSISDDNRMTVEDFKNYYLNLNKNAVKSYYYLFKTFYEMNKLNDPYFIGRLKNLREKVIEVSAHEKKLFLSKENIKKFLIQFFRYEKRYKDIKDLNFTVHSTGDELNINKNFKFYIKSNLKKEIDFVVNTFPSNVIKIKVEKKTGQDYDYAIIIYDINYIGPLTFYIFANPESIFFDQYVEYLYPLLPMKKIKRKIVFYKDLDRYIKNSFRFNFKKHNGKVLIFLASTANPRWNYYMFNMILMGKNKGKLQYLPVYNDVLNKEYNYWDWRKGFLTSNFEKELYFLLFIASDKKLSIKKYLTESDFYSMISNSQVDVQVLKMDLREYE